MSIRSSVQRSNSPVSLSSVSPHLIIVRDQSLGQKLSEFDEAESINRVSTSGRGRRTTWTIGLDHVWRYGQVFAEHDWEDDEFDPSWIDTMVSESLWSKDNRRGIGSRRVAWMVDDRLIVTSGYIFTLDEYMLTLPTDSITYSHVMRSWVASSINLNETDGLRSKLLEYDILISPELESLLGGSEKWREILSKAVEDSVANGYKLPSIFATDRSFKPHQESAILAMANRGHTILADQVGLGKGGEFINGYLSVVQKQLEEDENANVWPLLVVTTANLKEDIAEEIVKWKSDAKVEVLYGHKSQPISPRAEFVVTNADIISKRSEDILEAKIKGMVVDEAHMLKNPDTKRSEAALRFAEYLRETQENPYIVLASGTPFLNRPVELWSLLCVLGAEEVFADYAAEKLGGRIHKINTRSGYKFLEANSKNLFERYFCDGHYDRYKAWLNGGSSHTIELNQLLLQHVMIRRRKSDVMNPMPTLEEQMVVLEMDSEYSSDYDDAYDDFRSHMKKLAVETAREEGTSERDALRLVTRKMSNNEHIMQLTHLRQTVAKAKIAGTKEWIKSFMDGDLEYTDSSGNHIRVGDDPDRRKLIVFAYHREVQRMLIEDPDLVQYGMVSIVSGENPEEAKRLFQEDDRVRLIICYSGAREGHTLTAAKDVYIVEVPFVPSWVIQMAGRCWARLSEQYEPHEATVWYGVVPGTVDSNLVRKVRIKKQSFAAVIDGEDTEELEEQDNSPEAADALMSMLLSGRKGISIAA